MPYLSTKPSLLALLTACALFGAAGDRADAQSAGDWLLGGGLSYVVPKSADVDFRGITVELDGDTGLAFSAEYFLTDTLGVEFYFGGNDFFSDPAWLPPVLGLNYHVKGLSWGKPFLGAGVNYGAISTADAPLGLVDIKDSFGLALHAGVDIPISERDYVRFSARYTELDFQIDFGSADIGNATLEPVILGLFFVRRF